MFKNSNIAKNGEITTTNQPNKLTIKFPKHAQIHIVSLTPGVTTIVGRNGSGKSKLIRDLREYLQDKNIPVYNGESPIGDARYIERFLRFNKHAKTVFVLLDDFDKGLSINVIRGRVNWCSWMTKAYPNLYLIRTANCYETTKDSRCISARYGLDVEFRNYDDFANFNTKNNYPQTRKV